MTSEKRTPGERASHVDHQPRVRDNYAGPLYGHPGYNGGDFSQAWFLRKETRKRVMGSAAPRPSTPWRN